MHEFGHCSPNAISFFFAVKMQCKTLEISAETNAGQTMFTLREKCASNEPQWQFDAVLRSCQYCPGCYDFSDTTEKRMHFLTQWHKTNVMRQHHGLSVLTLEQFTILPLNAFCFEGEFISSFSSSQLEQHSRNDHSTNCVITPWVLFLNYFSSTNLDERPLSQFPKHFSIHRSLFYIDPDDGINQEAILDVANKITACPNLIFTFIYITAEEYVIQVVDYCINRREIQLVFTKKKRAGSCRKKQGGSQLIRDKKGKMPMSVGSMLRRNNELNLIRDAISDLKSLKQKGGMQAYRCFVHISNHLKQYVNLEEVFGNAGLLTICKYPFDLQKPNDQHDSIHLIRELISLRSR